MQNSLGGFKVNYQFLFFVIFIFQSSVWAISTNSDAKALIRREMSERKIPGLQAAIVRNGKIIFLESFGLAEVQNSVSVTNKSVFPINSCTKAFTGVAVMQMVEDGKIELSALVSRYLEGLHAQWQLITIKQ